MTMNPVQSDEGEINLPVELAAPARRALVAAGYTRLEQLTAVSKAEINKLHGIGPNALRQLRHALEAKGLSFAVGKHPAE
jgi:hypothetical protein